MRIVFSSVVTVSLYLVVDEQTEGTDLQTAIPQRSKSMKAVINSIDKVGINA